MLLFKSSKRVVNITIYNIKEIKIILKIFLRGNFFLTDKLYAG